MRKFLILILPLIFGCHHNSRQQSFSESYYKLPRVTLPVQIHTNGSNLFTPYQAEITDTTLVSVFGNDYYWIYPIGRLVETENYLSVLSYHPTDVGHPIITTYQKDGVKIDSLWLFDEERVLSYEGYVSKQSAVITADYLIHFADSTDYIDKKDNVLRSEVIRKIFYIADDGKIKQR